MCKYENVYMFFSGHIAPGARFISRMNFVI